MIVLDTTVLVYAVGADHPLRAPCRAVVEAIAEGAVAGTTTVEVLQEFLHVRARRRTRSDAAAVTADFTTLLSPLLRPDVDDVRAGLALFGEHEALGAFDAVLAATCIRAGASALVSADRAFAAVGDLEHLDPADPGFLDALRRDTSR